MLIGHIDTPKNGNGADTCALCERYTGHGRPSQVDSCSQTWANALRQTMPKWPKIPQTNRDSRIALHQIWVAHLFASLLQLAGEWGEAESPKPRHDSPRTTIATPAFKIIPTVGVSTHILVLGSLSSDWRELKPATWLRQKDSWSLVGRLC